MTFKQALQYYTEQIAKGKPDAEINTTWYIENNSTMTILHAMQLCTEVKRQYNEIKNIPW